ncbi:unnamed protein product [Rhodiola kirilowii]
MAPSFDWALSSLLCAEENTGFLDDEISENDGSVETSSTASLLGPQRAQNEDQRFESWDSFIGVLCVQSDECLESMIGKESQHLPECDYLGRLSCGEVDLSDRMRAVIWIKKVHAHFGFGPLSLYLSVNYLDRFLSAYGLPEGEAWMMQLLAVACVSIAAKMEETEIPLSQDFQVADSKFVFEARTIQRMELLVLSTLRWRMQAVTPFSYLDSFLYRLNDDHHPPRTWINKSIQLILSTVEDIDYLEFRPSVVAAAVAIAVAGKNQTLDDTERAINLFGLNASKEKVVKCVEMLHDLVLMVSVGYRGSSSSVHSPIGVLDAARLSYKSDTATHFDSCASSSTNTPDNKRRKVNGNH